MRTIGWVVGHPRRTRVIATGWLFIMLTASGAVAQDQASIVGNVTDESEAVLPGVTITASSPALLTGQMVTVSGADGQYRLTNLPIGTYEVVYELPGFRPVRREGVRLTAGFTATLDVELGLGALEETITVSGASPVVDVVATRPSTTLTREELELIPTSRNGVQAMLSQAPGTRSNLDVGGNTAGAIPQFHAFGQGNGSWPVIEGIAINSPNVYTGIQPGNYIDYTAAEEARVGTFGNDAEMPTRGVQLSVIMKSGGNAYHGTLLGSYTNPDFISDNIDETLAAEGIRGLPILQRWDAAGNVGGFLVRDRLWFYAGLNGRANDNGVLDCAKPDGTPCETLLTQRFYSGKATYRLSDSHRLIGYYQWNLKDNETGASQLVEWNSHFYQRLTGNMGKGEWQGTFGNNLLANALVGFWNYDSWQHPLSDEPSRWDIGTQRRTGSSSASYWAPNDYYFGKYQVSGSVSWFGQDALWGDHNVKGGVDYIKGWAKFLSPEHPIAGDYILRFLNGDPYEVRAYNVPVDKREDDRYVAFFIKDQWSVGPRLTLNVGVRWSFDQAYIPDQSKEAGTFASVYPAVSFSRVDGAPWNEFVPRIHAAYDLTNDGLTVIKGGWGRFADIRGANHMAYLNPLSLSYTQFRWRDLNGDRDYDPGEVNLDPNGPDFVTQTGFTGQAILNREESAPMTDEFSVSVERQLVPNLAVRVSGIYARSTNNIDQVNPLIPLEAYTVPVTNLDPGPDGAVGTGDDPGTSITYWEYPSSLQGADFQGLTRINDPRLDASYRSVEVAIVKRLADRWQARGSYSTTTVDEPPGINNPNEAIFGGDQTREWTFKASGSYELPYEILGAVNYELRSGNPWQRTVLFTGGTTIPAIVLPVEPLGARHLDNVHLLDGRVRKEFRSGPHQLSVGMDVFNLLNVNTVVSRQNRSGSTFARTLTAGGNTTTLPFIPGRTIQFTLNYAF